MKNALCFLIVLISLFAQGEESLPEIIEVLAPKQRLTLSSNSHSIAHLNKESETILDRTIADSLSTLTGVSLNGQGGQFQSYAIRGFSRGRIRTELDGIPIITDRRAGNSISFIAPELITSGHVLKGPSSSIYGAQAMGGVVSLSTEYPEGRSFTLTGQSHNQGLNLTFKQNNAALSSAIAYQRADKSKTPNGLTLNTEFERVSALVRYQQEADGLTTTYSWLPSYGRNIGKSNIKYPTTEISDYPSEMHSLMQVQVSSEDRWLAKLFHHYQDWQSDTLRIDQYQSSTQYLSHNLGGQFLKHIELSDYSFHWGLDWLSRKGVEIDSEYTLFSDSTDTRLTTDFSAEEDNLGIYGQSQWQWGKAKVKTNLRYDWSKQRSELSKTVTEEFLSATVALNWAPSSHLNYSVELGNGFRYPTLSERFFSGITPRGSIEGNAELKAESSVGVQITTLWHATEYWSITGAIYRYELDDYIERYRVAPDTLSYRNLSRAHVQGLELQANWYPTQHWMHYFSFEQQSGKDNNGVTLADMPPSRLTWKATYENNKWAFANAIIHYLSSGNVAETEETRDRFTLWHLSLHYELDNDKTLAFKVNNVTDTDYFATLDEDATLQVERNISMTIQWQF